MTLEEIAKELGISKGRAYVIEQTALRKLSHPKNLKKWQNIYETIRLIKEERAKNESEYKF